MSIAEAKKESGVGEAEPVLAQPLDALHGSHRLEFPSRIPLLFPHPSEHTPEAHIPIMRGGALCGSRASDDDMVETRE